MEDSAHTVLSPIPSGVKVPRGLRRPQFCGYRCPQTSSGTRLTGRNNACGLRFPHSLLIVDRPQRLSADQVLVPPGLECHSIESGSQNAGLRSFQVKSWLLVPGSTSQNESCGQWVRPLDNAMVAGTYRPQVKEVDPVPRGLMSVV